MPQARTFLFIFISLIISAGQLLAQPAKPEWRYEGPRVGIDLSRFLMSGFQHASRTGWEVQADIPWKGNFFPTVEFGTQQFDDKKDNFRYQNNGFYGRAGIDLNILKFESLSDGDLLFVGARYGYSRFKHWASDVVIPNYWGDYYGSIPERNMNAHWAEIVFGMKGELAHNFFIGWSLRAKILFSKSKDPVMSPYIIPGMGKTTGDIPFDFSFGVYYRFPLRKTQTLPKPLQMGGKSNDDEEEDDQFNNSGGSYNQGGFNRGGSSGSALLN